VSILSRYILKKFIRPFAASFGALCVLIMVSQMFERLDRLLGEGVGLWHVVGYLATSLPLQALQVLPVACMLGTLFVVGNLARTREYIAGLAGGIPPERFLGGLMIAGAVISAVALAASETVVPAATRYSQQVFREKIRRLGAWHQSMYTNLFVTGVDGRIWSIKEFNEDSGRMERVVVDTFAMGGIRTQIDALSAQWNGKSWTFHNGVVRDYKDSGFTITSMEAFTERDFEFKERPFDLVTQEPEADEMNYRNLKAHINRLSSLGIEVRKLQVELMMKLSFPFSCFVVIFLGVPLAMRGKGSRAMGIAAAGGATLLYNGFIQMGKVMAQRLVAPWLGAWLGNLIFFAIAVWLWFRMRRTA
jgi:lipopolysaccharide export system permease protein